ncbi:hypothetical protein J7M28_06350 [bacterium]|nr:hypothetical protein [bacterium]
MPEIVRFFQGMPNGLWGADAAARGEHLGLKGAGLVRLAELGLPTPDGFVIPIDAIERLRSLNIGLISEIKLNQRLPTELIDDLVIPEGFFEAVKENIAWLEERNACRFGEVNRPLLVSVRSGGTVSLPGLMATVCNVGLTRQMIDSIEPTDTRRGFLLDCFRRFIESFGGAARGIKTQCFRDILREYKSSGHSNISWPMNEYLSLCPVPSDPWSALRFSIFAVMLSCETTEVASFARTIYIRERVRTAVTVQKMVFGNLDAASGSGVVFSRNPSTGEPSMKLGGSRVFGQIILQSQGVDVVQDLDDNSAIQDLQQSQPSVCEKLAEIARTLEKDSGHVQDIEFTLESGNLHILQARPARMAPAAFLRAQLDMVAEGITSEADVIKRTDPRQLERVLSCTVTSSQTGSPRLIGSGSPLVPGYATGRLCFDIRKVRQFKSQNEPVIFCCERLLLSHIHVLEVVDGIISSQRNVLSHATLNARYLGRPSVVKASVRIDSRAGTLRYGGDDIPSGILKEGDTVSIDAHRGHIYEDQMEIRVSGIDDPIAQRFCSLVTSYGGIKVYAQAEDHETYAVAKRLGADGVANFRSDVLFFKKFMNVALCDYVLSVGTANEPSARERLLLALKRDFAEIFRTMDENYIAIRLIKHTMYEYFPKERSDLVGLAEDILRARRSDDPRDAGKKLSSSEVEKMVRVIRSKKRLQEDYNPIIGRRGVRLATTLPEIYEIEIKAILLAMLQSREEGKELAVDMLIPYVCVVGEFLFVKGLVDRIAIECGAADLEYGTAPVIEMSGILFEMDKIAAHTGLVVIRSDKLTTSTHHIAREDAEEFLPEYVDRGWFYGDPFRVIQESTERIVRQAVQAAKQSNPAIRIMVSGTHCANEYSLRRLLDLGINEVSCPPIMVPVAKLIAAKIEETGH